MNDESFLKSLSASRLRRQEIINFEAETEARVKETLTSEKLINSFRGSNSDIKATLEKAADELVKQLKETSSVTIDARTFLGKQDEIYNYPIVTFSNLGELLDQVYLQLQAVVGPYEYGHSWVLQNKANGRIIKSARMLLNAPPGMPVPDKRVLYEVGIAAGSILEVVRPRFNEKEIG